MVIQGAVGTIGRRCVLCGKRWDAKHPNDPNIFCERCTEKLRELTAEGETNGHKSR